MIKIWQTKLLKFEREKCMLSHIKRYYLHRKIYAYVIAFLICFISFSADVPVCRAEEQEIVFSGTEQERVDCYFGTDVDKKENLIAHGKTVEEIRQEIGADSLEYLSMESLKEITKDCKVDGFCDGCFTGKYPIEVPKEIDKDRFEKIQF